MTKICKNYHREGVYLGRPGIARENTAMTERDNAAYPWAAGAGRPLRKGPVLWLDPLGPWTALVGQVGGEMVPLSRDVTGSIDPLRAGPEQDEEGV